MRVVVAGIALLLTACGYHVAGHTDLIPKTIHTVCIPAFTNTTTRYKLTDRMPEAIAREFNAPYALSHRLRLHPRRRRVEGVHQ